jgi:hypothetical protein
MIDMPPVDANATFVAPATRDASNARAVSRFGAMTDTCPANG